MLIGVADRQRVDLVEADHVARARVRGDGADPEPEHADPQRRADPSPRVQRDRKPGAAVGAEVRRRRLAAREQLGAVADAPVDERPVVGVAALTIGFDDPEDAEEVPPAVDDVIVDALQPRRAVGEPQLPAERRRGQERRERDRYMLQEPG